MGDTICSHHATLVLSLFVGTSTLKYDLRTSKAYRYCVRVTSLTLRSCLSAILQCICEANGMVIGDPVTLTFHLLTVQVLGVLYFVASTLP